MKKITLVLMSACLSLIFLPLSSFAVSVGHPGIANTTTPAPVKADALVLRLNEIKNMDKSNLSSSEKKALLKELRGMKRADRDGHPGSATIFIIGGLIIVILVLLLIK